MHVQYGLTASVGASDMQFVVRRYVDAVLVAVRIDMSVGLVVRASRLLNGHIRTRAVAGTCALCEPPCQAHAAPRLDGGTGVLAHECRSCSCCLLPVPSDSVIAARGLSDRWPQRTQKPGRLHTVVVLLHCGVRLHAAAPR
jgi:hypothetical protein